MLARVSRRPALNTQLEQTCLGPGEQLALLHVLLLNQVDPGRTAADGWPLLQLTPGSEAPGGPLVREQHPPCCFRHLPHMLLQASEELRALDVVHAQDSVCRA